MQLFSTLYAPRNQNLSLNIGSIAPNFQNRVRHQIRVFIIWNLTIIRFTTLSAYAVKES